MAETKGDVFPRLVADVLSSLRSDSCAECRFYLWEPAERDEGSGVLVHPSHAQCLFNLNAKERDGKCTVGIRR